MSEHREPCEYCGGLHRAMCPRILAITYAPDGSKRIEFRESKLFTSDEIDQLFLDKLFASNLSEEGSAIAPPAVPTSAPPAGERLAWIKSICTHWGISPTALAKKAGLAQTTLSRFLRDPEGHMLTEKSTAKLLAAQAALQTEYGRTQPA